MKNWTENNTIENVLESKLGYELLSFITYYSGKSIEELKKIYLLPLPLKAYKLISKLSGIEFNRQLIRWIIEKLNKEDRFPFEMLEKLDFEKKWWKEGIIYHIFVPSFFDSNDDGYGDLKGIIKQFEYLLSLNISAILLSPIFDSPMYDAGYDISDHYEINPKLGTKEDLKELIVLCKQHNIKLILTFPMNQTSEKNSWFLEVTESNRDPEKANKYKDYYINKDMPNNWLSHYSASAWRYERIPKSYFLHLKSNHQPDINWHNPELRKEMILAMKYWQDFGIDGFFLESSGIMVKDENYPDGNRILTNLTGITGIEHYTYQYELLTYLEEIYQELKKDNSEFLIIADNQRMHSNYNKLISGDATLRSDLGLSYLQFENPGERRFASVDLSLYHLSNTWFKMQKLVDNSFWPVLFCEDPKHTRIVSRITQNKYFRTQIAKLLSMLQLTAKGTPIVYQGQELGQVNASFHDIEQIRDIESQNKYEELNKNPEIFDQTDSFEKIIRGSRDHARIPLAWNNSKNNGFSKNEKTWIDAFADPGMTIEDQRNDSHSVLNFYRNLISMRTHFTTLIYGSLFIINNENKNMLRYLRYDNEHAFYIEINLTDDQLNTMGLDKKTIQRLIDVYDLDLKMPQDSEQIVLLGNYPDRSQQELVKNSPLRAFEAFIVKIY
ncbi:MAG: hypothetical protein GX326_03480 [Clostridiaceae bacterium]|nr:hypothetical protein [Clostridiaceae bacterium]